MGGQTVESVVVSPVNRDVVGRLVVARMARGMSQQDVADAMRRTQGEVSKLEAGRDGDLRLCDLAAYARAVGLSVRVRLVD